MQIGPKTIKNILVVRNDRFGEFLLNIPAFRALKETFTNSRIIAMVNPYVKELAQNVPYVDEVIEKTMSIGSLRKRNIDVAIMLNPSKELNILTYLAGIPMRVGYDRKWGFLLTHKIEDTKSYGKRHEVEYNLELVGLIGAKTQDKSLCLEVDNGIIENLLNDLALMDTDYLVALHPWTSDPIKQWPLERFLALSKRLLEYSNVKVVIVGGKEELGRSEDTFNGLGDNLINLTGRTTLIQLAALFKHCKVLISGDSGPVHLACSVGTPVLAIFRNDIPGKSPRRWGPWGEGHLVIAGPSLLDISVDEVAAKFEEIF